MVLLIIDAQRLIATKDLYLFDTFLSNVKELIRTARENAIEVIYIRHDDGPGKALSKGTEGFEIYDEFRPVADEKVYDKTVNSAFLGTGLLEYLRSIGEQVLIIAGLQTDYCIDATIKCGFEHGFQIFVPANANSTFDNEFMSAENSYKYYNELMWNGRYARCVSCEEMLDMMKR